MLHAARKTKRFAATAALLLGAIMIAPPAATAEDKEAAAAELEFGEMLVMQRCANCHSISEDEKRFAAPLHHLFGRMPGSIEGFIFSPNMKNIGIAWSPSTLDNWLAQTTFNTPDIRMRHVGIEKMDQRQAVIAYLKTLPGNSPAETPK